MRNPLITIGAFMLLLTACTPLVEQLKEQGVEVEVMEESEEMNNETMNNDQEEKEENKDGGSYSLYQEGVIGQGEKIVLFFHATWCPYCIENDARLTKFYSAAQVPLSTYRVDFDTANELKTRFGVTQQDTFIVLDE